MEDIGFDVVAEPVPAEALVGLADIAAGAFFDFVEVDEGFVGDHAGEGEPVEGGIGVVVVAAAEVAVIFDGEHLFEDDEAVEDGGAATGGEGDYEADAVWGGGGEVEGAEPADAGTDDGVERVDAEVVEEEEIGADVVVDGDVGELGSPWFAGGWVGGGWAGGSVATAEGIGADDEPFAGVEGLAWADEVGPPAVVAFFGPAAVGAGDVGVEACGVVAAGEGVEEEDGVAAVGVEFAP